MSFHVVIPARLASTRLPNKVLRDIAGRPMIEHVCRAAFASAAISVNVATDSDAIAMAAEQAGARAVRTASHHSCGSDRIAELLATERWADDEIIVNVQADEPMMPPALIDQVGGALVTTSWADMATAATAIDELEAFVNPNVVKVVASTQGRALYFSRAPIPYHRESANTDFAASARRHLGIYAYRAGALKRFAATPPTRLEQQESLEQLRAFDIGLQIVLVDAVAIPGPGVDTEQDLIAVQQSMSRR